MIYEFENCVLETDAEENRKLYEKLPLVTDECTCDGCASYMLAAEHFPEKVRAFFDNLGIDIRKASEVFAWGSENDGKSLYYGGFYHLCGRIVRNSCHDENTGTISLHKIADGYSVWFTEDISLAEDCLGEKAVQMEIDFHGVPWMLDKDNSY